jgi:Glycosyltransferase family 87
MRPQLVILPLLILALALGAAPARAADYDPANQPPFGGEPVPQRKAPASQRRPPSGFHLSATEAIRVADRNSTVRDERAQSPGMRPRAFTRGSDLWQVSYYRDGTEVAQVLIDDPSGAVLDAWRDHQVETKLARGYEDAVAGNVSEAYIWLPLCVLFVIPFFDPRRPLRLLHLDLLVLLGFGVSQFFFNKGEITTSVPLTYPVLGYLFVRMLVAGLRPRGDPGPLIPVIRLRWLAYGAVALAAFHVALNIVDGKVIDIGLAGVVGADRIGHGQSLYEGVFAPGIDLRGDVYGPFNYLAYLPFELLFPWSGHWDAVPAAHVAAIAFDLLCGVGLLALGRRLRPGEGGRALGIALAYAWFAYPYTLYTLDASSNDSLIALILIGAMIALASPVTRGAVVALGAAAKFGPAAVAPLFATGTGERRWRSAALFAIAFAVVAAIVTLPFIPDGGLREVYDRTLGYQAGRGSPFSIWGLAPSLHPLQTASRIFAVALALAAALYPRRKSPAQVAALAAAVIIATQVASTHWFYFYAVWFLPLVLVTIFMRQSESPAPRESAT